MKALLCLFLAAGTLVSAAHPTLAEGTYTLQLTAGDNNGTVTILSSRCRFAFIGLARGRGAPGRSQ